MRDMVASIASSEKTQSATEPTRARRAFCAADRVLRAIDGIGETIATVLILATMAIVFADVALRHFFNSPLPWAYDLIGMYLLAGIYFLALSGSYAGHAHVGVDIIVRRLPEPFRRLSEMATSLIGTALFGAIAYAALGRAVVSFINDDRVSGLIAWPTWISSALVAVGSVLLGLRLVFRLVGNAASLALQRAVVDPLPITGEPRGE
jgi:TRAP-type C4-dicarboxylate transport system permease small subunit